MKNYTSSQMCTLLTYLCFDNKFNFSKRIFQVLLAFLHFVSCQMFKLVSNQKQMDLLQFLKFSAIIASERRHRQHTDCFTWISDFCYRFPLYCFPFEFLVRFWWSVCVGIYLTHHISESYIINFMSCSFHHASPAPVLIYFLLFSYSYTFMCSPFSSLSIFSGRN